MDTRPAHDGFVEMRNHGMPHRHLGGCTQQLCHLNRILDAAMSACSMTRWRGMATAGLGNRE